jgi:hypothetical protein
MKRVCHSCTEAGNSLDERPSFGHGGLMTNSDQTHALSWPWWAKWALLAIVATSVLTVAATLNDIL